MIQLSKEKTNYNLEERTAKFGEDVIDFVRTIKQDAVNRRIIEQLVGSVGSAGANYCEATEAESKKDFVHKIAIAKKRVKRSQTLATVACQIQSREKGRNKEVLERSSRTLTNIRQNHPLVAQ